MGILIELAVEEMPGVLGQLANLLDLLGVEVLLVLRELLAKPVHQEGCDDPKESDETCDDISEE